MPIGQALIDDVNRWSGGDDRLAFWSLGQAGVIVKLAGRVVYVDPYLSPSPRRLVPPLVEPGQVTHADLVVCTHDHSDHIDPGALPGIAAASPQAVFVVPPTAVDRVAGLGIPPQRVRGLNAGHTLDVGPVTVTAIKARHEFFDRTPDGDYPYLGYVIQASHLAAYHAGDTLVYDGLVSALRAFRLAVAWLPINGRDATRYRTGCIGNMTYQEAVDLAGELAPSLAVPIHYDMFAHNSEDPQRFVDYLDAKYPTVASAVAVPGVKIEVDRGQHTGGPGRDVGGD